MDWTKGFCLSVVLVALGRVAFAQEAPTPAPVPVPSVIEMREAFSQMEIPDVPDLAYLRWVCDSRMAFGSGASFRLLMFSFAPAIHSPTLAFNNYPEAPGWIPRWMARYQGFRTSIPIGTNDFIKLCDESAEFASCLQEGSDLRIQAYARMTPNRQTLMVEWTVNSQDERLKYAPVSKDTERQDPKAFLYSTCHRETRAL